MTKQQLLDDFGQEWEALTAVVNAADDQALVDRTDAAGWNARDHLAHLIYWLQGVTHMVRKGKPQHVGMNISAELLSAGDYDAMNEVIRERTINWSVPQVMKYLQASHQEMIGLISKLSDDDLLKPVDEYVDGDRDISIGEMIQTAGPGHYRQHRGWIETILDSGESAT